MYSYSQDLFLYQSQSHKPHLHIFHIPTGSNSLTTPSLQTGPISTRTTFPDAPISLPITYPQPHHSTHDITTDLISIMTTSLQTPSLYPPQPQKPHLHICNIFTDPISISTTCLQIPSPFPFSQIPSPRLPNPYRSHHCIYHNPVSPKSTQSSSAPFPQATSELHLDPFYILTLSLQTSFLYLQHPYRPHLHIHHIPRGLIYVPKTFLQTSSLTFPAWSQALHLSLHIVTNYSFVI